MGWFEDLQAWYAGLERWWDDVRGASGAPGGFGQLPIPGETGSPNLPYFEEIGGAKEIGGATKTEEEKALESQHKAKQFLLIEAALLGGVTAAPVAYALLGPKRGKKGKAHAQHTALVSDASTRAVALLGAFGPALALPLTYITVQKLEDAGYISGGLGDSVQALMTAGAAGGLFNAVAKLIP